jgi:hypothetical protein
VTAATVRIDGPGTILARRAARKEISEAGFEMRPENTTRRPRRADRQGIDDVAHDDGVH